MAKSNSDIIDGLKILLADTFVLYFKTHSFHWNVEGPNFKSLHELFQEQYTELWNATDVIAERMRALGAYAPDNFATLLKTTRMSESDKTPGTLDMLKTLANDNTQMAENIKPVIELAQANGDEVTADLLIGRMTVHEKAAWMLRSSAK